MSCVVLYTVISWFFFFFSSRRRHTRCALVTGVQTCALPIWRGASVEAERYGLSKSIPLPRGEREVMLPRLPQRDAGLLHQHGLVEQLHAGVDRFDGGRGDIDQAAHLQDGADECLGFQRAAGLDVLQHGGLVLAHGLGPLDALVEDRKSTRLNSSHSRASRM